MTYVHFLPTETKSEQIRCKECSEYFGPLEPRDVKAQGQKGNKINGEKNTRLLISTRITILTQENEIGKFSFPVHRMIINRLHTSTF